MSSPDFPSGPFPVHANDPQLNFQSLLPPQNSDLSSQHDCPDLARMDSFQTHFPGLANVKLEESSPPSGAKASTPSSLCPTAPAVLSSQAAVGAGATKVSKRRSRAINKPPITVLSADRSNFRDMVQKLTGIPASPSLQCNRFQLWSTPSGISLLKPHPTRPAHSNQGTPTLDTSSGFVFLEGNSPFTQASQMVHNQNRSQSFPSLSFLQSLQQQTESTFGANLAGDFVANPLNPASFTSNTSFDLKALLASHLDILKQGNSNAQNTATPNLEHPRDDKESDRARERFFAERPERGNNPMIKTSRKANQGMVPEEEHSNRKLAANLDSLLMGNDGLNQLDFPSRTLHTVDSWLACDGVHATPKMELAHSA